MGVVRGVLLVNEILCADSCGSAGSVRGEGTAEEGDDEAAAGETTGVAAAER